MPFRPRSSQFAILAVAAVALCATPPTSIARVQPPAPVHASESATYTGIIVDARHLPTIDRSPAPFICGPDDELLYPDRTHVPNADEVQDQSIVRYYLTEDGAEKGAAGEHPLFIRALSVIGPAHDGLQVSAPDAERLKAADKDCQYTRTWKVAFLLPEGR